MSKVKVLFFATLRDRAGTRSAEFELPSGTTVAMLKQRVEQQYPGIAPSIKTSLAAINREFAKEDIVIPDDAEVAFFPPVSGG